LVRQQLFFLLFPTLFPPVGTLTIEVALLERVDALQDADAATCSLEHGLARIVSLGCRIYPYSQQPP